MSADDTWTRWVRLEDMDGQIALAPPSPPVETQFRSPRDMPPPPRPDRPKIRDPLTGLPYQPVNWWALEMITRGKTCWCLYSIPGTLYFLSRILTQAPHNDRLRYRLDCRHNDLAERLGKLEEQEMYTYTRLYMRWLMTETPHRNLATVNPDGTVLLTPNAQASIYILRQAVTQTQDVSKIMEIFRGVLKDRSKRHIFDWAYVLQTEPTDYLPLLWSGVMPEPVRYMTRSSFPALNPQPERELMKEPYTPAAHEAARAQDQLARTRPVAGASVLWIPRQDDRNIISWAPINNLVLFSRRMGVDPFNLEMDGRSRRKFDTSLFGDVSLDGAPLQGNPVSSIRRRNEFWLENRAKSDFYFSLPDVTIDNPEQQDTQAKSTAGTSRRANSHNIANTSRRPSRIVKLKIRPALLAQRLAKIQRQGNHFTGTTGTMFTHSRPRLGALHDAIIERNSTASINGVPYDNASMTVAAWTPYKHQYPPEELDERYETATENAHTAAFGYLDWELATTMVERRRWNNPLLAEKLAEQRLGVPVVEVEEYKSIDDEA